MYVHTWRRFAEGVLQVVLFTISWFKKMKKHCVAKVLRAIWEIFLHENNFNCNSYRFSYKFAFILFLCFLTNQKQEYGFQQADGLVTRNIFVFLFTRSRALLQSHTEFNRLLQRSFLTSCYSCSYTTAL